MICAMEELRTLLASAVTARTDGQVEAALNYYSDAFNVLVATAAEYARTETGSLDFDDNALREIAPLLMQSSKEYLMRDLTAAAILDAMGVLFGEMGDYDNAKQKFEEAIEFIPEGMTYDEPTQHLMDISSRVIQNAELETIDE